MKPSSAVRAAVRGAAPILVVGAVACSGNAPPAGGEASHVDGLPRLTLVEEQRIGSVNDPDYGFSSVRSVDVDRDGRLYVFESRDRQIRVYAPDGRLLRLIGGSGQGPGEFGGTAVDFGVLGDTVWAMDWSGGVRRLTLFDREGRLLLASRIEEAAMGSDAGGMALVVGPRTVGAGGLLIADRDPSRAIQVDGSPDSLRVPRVRFDWSGSVVDTAGWYTIDLTYPPDPRFVSVGASRYLMPSPPSVEPLDIPLPDGRVRVERPVAGSDAGGVFTVTRLDFSGDTLYSVAFRYRPAPFPEARLQRTAALASRSGSLTYMGGGQLTTLERHAADSARAHALIRREMPYPERQPPIPGDVRYPEGSFHLGRDGALWLTREEREDDTRRWLILDPEGAPRGEVSLPASGLRVVWSRGDTVWAVETGELGVPWLVRFRLR